MSITTRLVTLLDQAVKAEFERFDAKTGRFLKPLDGPPAPDARPEDIGWGIINQDIIYPLALLYTTPESEFYQNPDVLQMALLGGDAIRQFQQPDGQVEFLKTDGSRWGFTYMCWTNYAWLETYQLLKNHLGSERRKEWETGLRLAHDGQKLEVEKLPLHNIPAWKGMSCWRAGQIFQRADWQEAGRNMCRAIARAQHPDGYWPEQGGPSTLYNCVYVHSLGLYYHYSGDEAVLPALEKSAEFHQTFCYPDGTLVETVDGRVRYHSHLSLFGWPGFLCTPKGRRLTRLMAENLQAGRDITNFQGGSIASAIQHWKENDSESINLDQPAFQINYRNKATIFRNENAFACLSAFQAAPVNNRWGLDRQSFFSLWLDKLRLLVGGGNSKEQPEFSSFLAAGKFIPDQAELSEDGSCLNLHYGPVTCSLSCKMEKDRIRLQAEAQNGPALQQLMLQLKAGSRLRLSNGKETILSLEHPVSWRPQELGNILELDGCTIHLPPNTHFRWPVFPFNPYAADGAAGFGAENALLSVRLDGQPVGWEFHPKD